MHGDPFEPDRFDSPDDTADGSFVLDDLDAWLDVARHEDHPAEAIERLEAALELFPNRPDIRLALAYYTLADGRFADAAERFAELAEDHPNDPELAAGHAASLVAMGRAREALTVIDAALDRDPDHAPLWCQKLAALLHLQRFVALQAAYDEARHHGPPCPTCDLWLGEMYLRTGEVEPAARIARRLAALPRRLFRYPQRVHDLPLFLGRVALAGGQPEQAADAFVTVRPAYRGLGDEIPRAALRLAALAYLRSHRPQAALQLVVRRCTDRPGHTPPGAADHLLRAEVMLHAGCDLSEVRSAAETALWADPTLPGVHLLLAELALLRSALPLARSHLTRETRLNDLSDDEQVLRLALAWTKARRPRRALAVLNRRDSLTLPPSADLPMLRADLLALRAALLLRKRRYAEGRAAAFAALGLRPHDPHILHNLALAECRRGHFGEARGWASLMSGASGTASRHATLATRRLVPGAGLGARLLPPLDPQPLRLHIAWRSLRQRWRRWTAPLRGRRAVSPAG